MDKPFVILCVDDEDNILKSLKRILRSENYNIFTALSGAEGLKILETEQIDLVISDQRMPVMSGSEFLKIVKEKYPDTIRIMLSGYSDFDNLIKAINEGEIFRFISKPWNTEELKKIIRIALEQKKAISVVMELIQNICNIIRVDKNVSVEIEQEQKHIKLKICNNENDFSNEIISSFMHLLFDYLNDKGYSKGISGSIMKQNGTVMISIDIMKGVILSVYKTGV